MELGAVRYRRCSFARKAKVTATPPAGISSTVTLLTESPMKNVVGRHNQTRISVSCARSWPVEQSYPSVLLHHSLPSLAPPIYHPKTRNVHPVTVKRVSEVQLAEKHFQHSAVENEKASRRGFETAAPVERAPVASSSLHIYRLGHFPKKSYHYTVTHGLADGFI